MDKKKKHTKPEERIELLADLLRDVADQLPVSTKSELIDLCIKAFDKNGYKDEYENPFFVSYQYAAPRWKLICNEAACGNDGVFVKYVRERVDGQIIGEWRKVNKHQWVSSMETEARSIATRIDNYTYNKETGLKRWKNILLPGFDIQQLPSGL